MSALAILNSRGIVPGPDSEWNEYRGRLEEEYAGSTAAQDSLHEAVYGAKETFGSLDVHTGIYPSDNENDTDLKSINQYDQRNKRDSRVLKEMPNLTGEPPSLVTRQSIIGLSVKGKLVNITIMMLGVDGLCGHKLWSGRAHTTRIKLKVLMIHHLRSLSSRSTKVSL